jgi:hypothetical protein
MVANRAKATLAKPQNNPGKIEKQKPARKLLQKCTLPDKTSPNNLKLSN